MSKVDHTKNIIEIKNVSFSYGEEQVLKDISFNVHQGDYLGLIGPNGGGKTTLLKIILGLIKPAKGTVLLFGEDISRFKDWSKIGYVPQHAVRFDSNYPATVDEVVAMGLYGKKGLFKGLNASDKQRISEVIACVGMSKYRNRLIGDLSGGQRQRVFIARGLVSEPEVLFLDEPTAGVDVKAQDKFYKLLHELNQKYDLTLVLVSHDIEVIAAEATEFASINQKLVYHGTPEDFLKSDYLKESFGKNLHFIQHKH
jgi:zinc transport system ATP-binding protein